MKRGLLLLSILLLLLPPLPGYRLIYREQLYELFHRQLTVRPLNPAENIVWLEQALAADFANPLYALVRVKNPRDHELYRALLTMQIHLLLVDQYLQWASLYFKFEAYWYNQPWREQNLESLDRAEDLLEIGLYYWEQARQQSDIAARFAFLYLEGAEQWQNRSHRIQTGQLDYEAIITGHLARLEEVRQAFLAMPPPR